MWGGENCSSVASQTNIKVIVEQAEKLNLIFFSPYSLLRLSIKYRTVAIIAELAIIAIIMNQFIVRDGAGAIGVVAIGVGVCSEAGVGEGKREGIREGAGKV